MIKKERERERERLRKMCNILEDVVWGRGEKISKGKKGRV